jgi:hypothetical protein
VIMFPRCNHGLGRRLERHGGAEGEVAGIGRHEQVAVWLQIWAGLRRPPGTIDAYTRGLAEYLLMCEREDVDPVTANRAHVAVYVRELSSRPSASRRRRPGSPAKVEEPSCWEKRCHVKLHLTLALYRRNGIPNAFTSRQPDRRFPQ